MSDLDHQAAAVDGAHSTSAPPLAASPELTRAVKRLLRPLVRLLVAKGLTYPMLGELLKGLYVEVAAKEFSLPGKRQTDSRLSLLTGVHRKDVRRLQEEPEQDQPVPGTISFGARLVARWCGDSRYLNLNGTPLPLPRLPQADGSPSFDALVAEESKDIRSRVVLDEWLRLGLASLDAQDRVCLKTSAFVPEKGFEEKAYFLGRTLGDHFAAASHNLLDGRPPFLDRCVYSDGLDVTGRAALAALAEKLGMDALLNLNRRARQMREATPDKDKTQRIHFGVYFYAEPTAAAASDQSGSPQPPVQS